MFSITAVLRKVNSLILVILIMAMALNFALTSQPVKHVSPDAIYFANQPVEESRAIFVTVGGVTTVMQY